MTCDSLSCHRLRHSLNFVQPLYDPSKESQTLKCEITSEEVLIVILSQSLIPLLDQLLLVLCTGASGGMEVNTPLESSTQYLLP